MRYPLFSEISHDDPVLTAYDEVYQLGDDGDPLAAAIQEYVQQNGGDPHSTDIQIKARDRLIGALIAQTFNLWQDFKRASQESEQYKRYFEEKMDELADVKAAEIRSRYPGAYRLHGPPGQGNGGNGDG